MNKEINNIVEKMNFLSEEETKKQPVFQDEDYTISIANEIIKHFKELGKEIPKRRRYTGPEFSWNEKEKNYILDSVKNIVRKVVATPCEFEDERPICWKLQYADLVKYDDVE